MTTDPAVIAAQRAWDATIARGGRGPNENPWLQSVDAAREALSPIREHIAKIPPGLDSVALYDELDSIYRRLLGGHCAECRND